MNVSEGVARIASVVRWLGWAWFIGIAAYVHYVPADSPWLERIGMALLVGGVPLVAAYIVAWILDGFAKGKTEVTR